MTHGRMTGIAVHLRPAGAVRSQMSGMVRSVIIKLPQEGRESEGTMVPRIQERGINFILMIRRPVMELLIVIFIIWLVWRLFRHE